MNQDVLNKLKAIKVLKIKDAFRPTRKLEDLSRLLLINNELKTNQGSKDLNSIILKTVFYAGMRISELINLKLEHIFLDENKILILHGKHGKNRWLGINHELKTDLELYIKKQRPASLEAYLFILSDGRKLTRDRLEKRTKLLMNKAGLPGGLHQWRRGCLTYYANKGVPVPQLQMIAGHANIETTMKYVNPCEEEVIRNQINY
jgi:integrase/recombinase XerD